MQSVEHRITVCRWRPVPWRGHDRNDVMPAGNVNYLCVPDVAVVERLYVVKLEQLDWELGASCGELVSVAAILRGPWVRLICEVR